MNVKLIRQIGQPLSLYFEILYITMAKIGIVYESKWGNTKQVAETIAEGIHQHEGIETVVQHVKDIDTATLQEYDAVLIGSPNHFGGHVKTIKKFINELGDGGLKGIWCAVFDTYQGRDFEKAVKKMEKQIAEKMPEIKLISPGLSVKVIGMKGPILEEDIPKCREFGSKIAAQVKP